MLEWVIVIDPANSVPMPAKKDLKPSAISSTPVIKGDSSKTVISKDFK